MNIKLYGAVCMCIGAFFGGLVALLPSPPFPFGIIIGYLLILFVMWISKFFTEKIV